MQQRLRLEWSVVYESSVAASRHLLRIDSVSQVLSKIQNGGKNQYSNTAVARAASHSDLASQLCGAPSSMETSSCSTYQHWNGLLFSLRVLCRMMNKERMRPSKGAAARTVSHSVLLSHVPGTQPLERSDHRATAFSEMVCSFLVAPMRMCSRIRPRPGGHTDFWL